MSVWRRDDGYSVSDEAARLDRDYVYGWLATQSYWARDLPRAVFERSVDGAMCFGIYAPERAQVGFARCISDRATFGYLGDIFVDDAHRKRGLSKFLVATILGHPELQGFRRWSLVTGDAHGLYARFGFSSLAEPGKHMERHNPNIYVRGD